MRVARPEDLLRADARDACVAEHEPDVMAARSHVLAAAHVDGVVIALVEQQRRPVTRAVIELDDVDHAHAGIPARIVGVLGPEPRVVGEPRHRRITIAPHRQRRPHRGRAHLTKGVLGAPRRRPDVPGAPRQLQRTARVEAIHDLVVARRRRRPPAGHRERRIRQVRLDRRARPARAIPPRRVDLIVGEIRDVLAHRDVRPVLARVFDHEQIDPDLPRITPSQIPARRRRRGRGGNHPTDGRDGREAQDQVSLVLEHTFSPSVVPLPVTDHKWPVTPAQARKWRSWKK